MAKDQLQRLFHQKKKSATPANVDWAAKRDEWIGAVAALYDTLANDYLAAAKDDVDITDHEKVATENYLGEYRIKELVLRVGDEQVVFSPKGANVVGAKGRIDILGDRGDASIVWQGGDKWSIVATRAPSIRLVPLTADSLADVLREIMRP